MFFCIKDVSNIPVAAMIIIEGVDLGVAENNNGGEREEGVVASIYLG